MIDGIKILNLPVNIKELLNNDLLNFPLPINDKTGEVLNYKTRFYKYKGLEFTIKNNNVKLNGSLHKYFNNGEHNHNDYNFCKIANTLIDLYNKFKINPYKTILNNVEFGVNISVPFDINPFLKSLINHKDEPFNPFNITGAIGFECNHTDYIIKIYNKSLQYKLTGNILRFEIKIIKMEYFRQNNIKLHTLSDLLNIEIYPQLATLLIDCFNFIKIYDNTIKTNKLTAKEQLIISNGQNPKYWERLKPKSKDFINGNNNPEYIRKRKKYYRELERYNKIVNKYSSSTIKNDISLLIENKCKELIFIDSEIRDKLTDFTKQFSNEIGDKLTDLKNTEKGQIDISNIVLNCPPLKHRFCLTCNKDISEKMSIAKFCSKKCKNDYTNPRLNKINNTKNRYKKINQNSLFDNYPFIIDSKRELLNKKNSIYNYV